MSNHPDTRNPTKFPITWTLEGKWVTGGFGLVLLLIGMVSFVSYQNAVQLAESAKRVRQTNTVLKDLTSISATLTDAEAGRRGYILFGDPAELARYIKAGGTLKAQIDRFRQSLADTPGQQNRLNSLERLISQRLKLFEQSIQQYSGKPRQLPAQDPLIAQLKQNRDAISQLTDALVAEE
ncbi:MAG TPA: CHASE3 domain-containing protein, partial [Leptolyngbya sp.]|nr:CHASE3 domain-containing protein [Leptolyngbya sp.]